ncbi:MAG: autotransporter outer membrane beta-barrel domain-containing protein [Gemmatimonadaceae bacterium]
MKLAIGTIVIVTSLAGLAGRSDAQSCVGTASFAAGIVRLGASAAFTDGAKQYSGGLALGAPHGVFAAVDAGSISYDGGGGASTVVGANLGYDVAVGPGASFCPIVAYSHVSFPDVRVGGSTITTSENVVAFGGAFGVTATVAPNLDLVPYLAGEYAHASASESETGVGSDSQSQDYGVLSVGVGFVINKMFTFGPSVAVPVGITGGKTSVSIGLSINFGHSGTAP